MGVYAHVNIKFWQQQDIEKITEILFKNGWHPLNPIRYECMVSFDDKNKKMYSAPLQDWEPVLKVLKKKVKSHIICMTLDWEQSSIQAEFCFKPDGSMFIFFLGFQPKITPNSFFTDYNWLYEKIVQPLFEGGCDIEKVSYEDAFD